MKKPFFLLALASLLAVSCLERNTTEAEPSLSPDVSEVYALADIYSGDSDSTKVIRITSNRSWSAHLNDVDNPIDEKDPTQSVPWGFLSVESHPNLSNSTEVFDLVVTFRRNFEKKQINGVVNIYSDGRKSASVKLTQAPVKYHLKVSTDVSKVGEHGEVVPVNVDCNTAWTVSVDESTTADLAYLSPKGFDPTVLGVNVLENEDKVEKKIKLTFSAEDCEDVSVEFTQEATTSELGVFEIFTKLSPSGNGTGIVPVLELDREAIFKKYPALADAKPKFYFTSSANPEEELSVPTKKNPAVPDEGWQIRPLKQEEYHTLNVFILGVAEGYRDSYCKVSVRDWKMGKNYTKSSTNGLKIGDESKLSPQTNYVTCMQDNWFSCKAIEGGNAQVMLRAHNAAYQPVGVFGVEGEEVSVFSFDTKYTNTSPTGVTSAVFKCDPDDEIRFTSTVARVFIWDFTVVEMKKVKQ